MFLLLQEEQENDIHRITVNTSDWTLQRRNLVPGPVSTDFPAINPTFTGRPYTYAYTNLGMYTAAPQVFAKVRIAQVHILHVIFCCFVSALSLYGIWLHQLVSCSSTCILREAAFHLDFRFQVNVRTGKMQQYPLTSGFR